MLVAIHRHKLLVEGNAPKPLFNTEFHSVATRSANAFLSVPSAPFRSIGVRESLTPFANRVRPKIEPSSKDGVAKYHPIFFLPATVATVATVLGAPPQNTVATVASVALYPITSNEDASTTMWVSRIRRPACLVLFSYFT